ncbi:MAG TPA: ribosome biogenesis GTPase YlqF [Firmicutes bacterium]|nr:ribosome biogenesis GTPase YlqF [Bacillota bacterium]
MKNIQWFPGHMAKAVRMMEENLKLCDAVVFVLDARAPASSFNPRLADMVGAKPVLYILNKGDLADGGADMAASAMQKAGKPAVRIAATMPSSARALTAAMEALTAEKRARLAEKGVNKPLRFLVAGIPNTGKSTVINLLAGGRKAQVGDKAGVTRAKQWVRCDAFELLDTPGTMPPSLVNQTLARRLAYLGSVNDDILDREEVALALLAELWEKYPAALAERYGIDGGAPLAMYEQLCRRRGFVLKGNDYDYSRGAIALLDDLRKGRLGKICLDNADDLREVGLI